MSDELNELEALTREIVEALEEKKAQEILVIDVHERSTFADRFVLATGGTGRQLNAMAQSLMAVAHRHGYPFHPEGREAMEWLLIDLGEVVVHLFLPEIRRSFQLEHLWGDSEPPAERESGGS